MDLTAEEIEQLNAHGPYNHAVWQGRGAVLSHEESLSGRGQFLVNLIRKVLTESYSREQMADMTIVDVGCYDGWILDQLVDLPFKKFVGIEPRQRNIDKGNTARSILGVKSRTEFRVASIEALGSEVFDIVICIGVLHHVESVGDAFRALRAICRKKLIIESLCLSSESVSPDLAREIEPKDIIYFGRAPTVGLNGYKFESSYYHGSAIRSSIVSIPSLPTIQMFLEYLGFQNVGVLIPPSAYWQPQAVKRSATACCLIAEPGPVTIESSQSAKVLAYESAMIEALLPSVLVETMYRRFCDESLQASGGLRERMVIAYVAGPTWLAPFLMRRIRRWWSNSFQREIVKNLRYAPYEKCALEMAKLRYSNGEFEGAIEAAMRITRRLNADWRATYRAFLIIARSFRRLGNEAMADRYFGLYQVSNPELAEELRA